MSLLQPILEQLHHERLTQHPRSIAARDGEAGVPGELAGAPAGEPALSALRSSPLGGHATWYRENLGQCSEPMLQYEWCWVNGRIEALLQCRGDNGAAAVASHPDTPWGDGFEDLLAEVQLFLTLLLREFAARGLRPAAPREPVLPSEKAGENASLPNWQDLRTV